MSCILTGVNPSVPASTTNPLTWSSATSRAHTMIRSAKVALPIHFFCPFSTQTSPSRRAVVVRPPATPGADVGLGQRERADLLHPGHRRQPALLLLVGPA